jgi:hypothetical protein
LQRVSSLMTEQENENFQAVAEGSSSGSWLETLPEEIRREQSLNKFKDVSALAMSYLEAEKSLNKRVALPGSESSNEEWQKFYQKTGLPEDKRYLEQRVAEDEEYVQAYEQMFHESGLSRRQGEKLLKSMYDYSRDLQKQQREELEKLRGSNIDWLKDNYSEEFDSKMTLMQAALQKFGSKELASLVEESHYAPPLIDFLVKIGGTLQSDSLITGGSSKPDINDADSALKEIKRLESDADFMVELNGKNHPAHEKAVKKMEMLYQLAYSK